MAKMITLNEDAVRKIIAHKYHVPDTEILINKNWSASSGDKMSVIVKLDKKATPNSNSVTPSPQETSTHEEHAI